MLDRARLTAATPCQRIRCVTLAKAWNSSWNSWDDIFSVHPMPHPPSDDHGLSLGRGWACKGKGGYLYGKAGPRAGPVIRRTTDRRRGAGGGGNAGRARSVERRDEDGTGQRCELRPLHPRRAEGQTVKEPKPGATSGHTGSRGGGWSPTGCRRHAPRRPRHSRRSGSCRRESTRPECY